MRLVLRVFRLLFQAIPGSSLIVVLSQLIIGLVDIMIFTSAVTAYGYSCGMTSNNLIPTPITDKNGKATTVYRSAETPQQTTMKVLPAPVMEAYVPPKKARAVNDESYASRRERIRLENIAEDGPLELANKGVLSMKAFESIGNLMMSAVNSYDKSEQEDFALSIGTLGKEKDFAAIILADRFGAAHYTIADSNDKDSEWDEPLEISFDGEDTSDWESEYTGINDYVQVIDLVMALREHGLMGRDEVPEHGEARFLAHLYLSASGKLYYRHDDDDTIAVMNIVDEFPEHTNIVAEGLDNGLHVEGIKALLDGDIHRGVASGAL